MSFGAQLQQAYDKAMEDVAAALYTVVDTVVKERALALIPRDTNTAADSVQVTMSGGASVVEVKLSFGSNSDSNPKTHQSSNDYIVPIHEDMSAAHPNGGQAKFLEQAVNESAPKLGAMIQGSMTKGP
jgi:hypothetical protein